MTTNTNSAQERTASIDLDAEREAMFAADPEGMEKVKNAGLVHAAMKGWLAARRSLTSGSPAEPAPSTVETEMADRLRRIIANHPGATIPVSTKTLATAADECDRFYNGMMNWKASAQAKDRTIIELREASAGAAAKTEQTCSGCDPAGGFCAVCREKERIERATAAGAGSAQPEAPNRDAGQEDASTQTVPDVAADKLPAYIPEDYLKSTSSVAAFLDDFGQENDVNTLRHAINIAAISLHIQSSFDAFGHATWALNQISNLDPESGSIGTAVFMARQELDYLRSELAVGHATSNGRTDSDSAAGTVEKDAARWRAFRSRDEFEDLDFTAFQDEFREDADAIIDAAIEAHNKAGKDQG